MEELALEQKELINLNLSDLLNLQVTSVSKKAQKISKAASAIFVITHQDIKNSGVTSIPEALRMAPGIDVARIDGNKWAISARGFNSRFSNKLLVLIDGRSVYTPFFSGVNWDVQDTLLEDIDRIEVIRGPGATLWGSNAVNGVINIITKKADQTQDGYLMAGGGSKERVFGGGRYGGKINDSTHYRVYGKYFERESNVDLNNQDANDQWQMERGGFRLDTSASSSDDITVQGDIYKGLLRYTVNQMQFVAPFNTTVATDAKLTGGNILLRWNKQLAKN
ncbi:MAG: TonB-dependent receptor, partial [Methylococcales bacterium]|nr:TonB-dependent receptor [Methylococcales bacterium]